MKYLALLLLFASSLASQTTRKAPRLDMTPHWQSGDRIVLERVKEKYASVNGKLTLQSMGKAEIRIQVLEMTGTGATIEWVSRGLKAQAAGPPQVARLINRMLDLTKGSRIVFATDVRGRPVALKNTEGVIKFYEGVTRRLSSWMKEQNFPEQQQKATLQQFAIYTNPRTVAFVVLRDPLVYFSRFEGVSQGAPVRRQVTFPNPGDRQGKNPFPAQSSLQLVKRQGPFDFVEFKQVLDQKRARRILLKAMQEEAIATGQPLPDEKQVPAFHLQNLIRMRFNRKTGFPEELTNIQTNVMGPNVQVNTVKFKRLPEKTPMRNTSRPSSAPAKSQR